MSEMTSTGNIPSGYGPRVPVFTGTDEDYMLWRVKFVAFLQLRKLGSVLLNARPTDAAAAQEYDTANSMVYAELVQALDDKSLGLIMNDAAYDGAKAINLLDSFYEGKSKPKVISLYTALTSLKKAEGEDVTSYIIRAEKMLELLR